jgi:hypothetical protein
MDLQSRPGRTISTRFLDKSVTEVAPEGSTWNPAKSLHRAAVKPRFKKGSKK